MVTVGLIFGFLALGRPEFIMSIYTGKPEIQQIGTGMLIIYSAPFLLVFALCYVDEPVRYVIMQFQMYSGKWIKPVSGEERRTIEDFRREHGIRIQKRDS